MELRKWAIRFLKTVYGQIRLQRLLFCRHPFFLFILLACSIYLADGYVASVSDAVQHNAGMAFSLPLYGYIPLYIALIAMFVLLIIYKRVGEQLFFPLILILSAGASNIIDRIMTGAVQDALYIGNWNGNIADILIVIGVLWAILNKCRRTSNQLQYSE